MTARLPPSSDKYLLDTNILLRLTIGHGSQHDSAGAACALLLDSGALVFITAQNLVEFWSVATRPASANGLGLSVTQATSEIGKYKQLFRMLPDVIDIIGTWEALVARYNVQGVQAHDARLAAVALAHGVPNFLTFNTRHFLRFAPSGLNPVDPDAILAAKA